ncbi:MAG: phosphatidylserine/phosphatidylglycerophosphate/cardiolipin synthase-like enzyme [Myxococcota bacterium]|jgi:phosphatidylserine/phosphatidylglycerophosphate/cardiolipin synthase-like enzyme
MMRSMLAILAVGCAAPGMGDAFHQMEVLVVEDADGATDQLVRMVDRAKDTLHIALPYGQDEALAGAVIDAWDRGVDVQVITDIDLSTDATTDPAIALLLQSGVPTTLADDEVAYFDFALGIDVSWRSRETLMSHGYVIADRADALLGTHVGALGAGERVHVALRGEPILEDLLTEHNQVFGGADATSPTAFDGMAKSIADYRWIYPTRTDVMVEIWFSPQERVTKRIIDAVYQARSSVRVLSDEMTNDGLALALQAKAANGFDVEVVVGPRFGLTSEDLSDVLRYDTPDVPKFRVPATTPVIPTLVLVDYEPDRTGAQNLARAHILSHDLYSAKRIDGFQRTVVNDQLIDGTLLVFRDSNEPSAELRVLADVYERYKNLAEAL